MIKVLNFFDNSFQYFTNGKDILGKGLVVSRYLVWFGYVLWIDKSDTNISLKRLKNIDAPYGFLAMTPRSLSKGSESPSSLTAVTRNLYSLPGFRPVTSNSVLGEFPGTLPTLTHFPVFVSIFSISYSLTGTPPSSSGFSHFTLAVVFVTSLTFRGPLGALGFPAERNVPSKFLF